MYRDITGRMEIMPLYIPLSGDKHGPFPEVVCDTISGKRISIWYDKNVIRRSDRKC